MHLTHWQNNTGFVVQLHATTHFLSVIMHCRQSEVNGSSEFSSCPHL